MGGIDGELRVILSDWVDYMQDLIQMNIVDSEVRSVTARQIKVVKEKYLSKPEESYYDVWKRLAEQLQQGKPVDMVDVIRVNNHMEDQKRLQDGAKRNPETDGIPTTSGTPKEGFIRNRAGQGG